MIPFCPFKEEAFMKMFVFLLLGTALFGQSQALSQLVYEIRNPSTDPFHFRQALEKIGEHLAREVLEELDAKETAFKHSQEWRRNTPLSMRCRFL